MNIHVKVLATPYLEIRTINGREEMKFFSFLQKYNRMAPSKVQKALRTTVVISNDVKRYLKN